MDFLDFIEYVYDNPYDYPDRRYLRDAENPMEIFDDVEFHRRFRFRKETVQHVLFPIVFEHENQNRSNRGLPIPPIIQLLVALRFYATGNFQIVCGDLHKISQSQTCKIVGMISRKLCSKFNNYIKFPQTEEACYDTKRKFHRVAGFPGVLGCIDCTHVPIKNPSRVIGEAFRNRKGWFSINVQLVCGPDLQIFDIVARWPGSVHDSRIFNNSRCRMRFEEGEISGILLGDSGYAQSHYMYTPILNPQTQPEMRYNRAHINTRNLIERVNGILKRRFACLSRKLQNNLQNTCSVIVSCAILHNICIMTREEMELEPDVNIHLVPHYNVEDGERGRAIREAFIRRHFT